MKFVRKENQIDLNFKVTSFNYYNPLQFIDHNNFESPDYKIDDFKQEQKVQED